MLTARFYQDGSRVLWALVQCGHCQTVHKYSTANALEGRITCLQCGSATDVRDAIRKAAAEWAEGYSQNDEDTLALLAQLQVSDQPAAG